jgi:limonene-1,2-epoxide hydrolase
MMTGTRIVLEFIKAWNDNDIDRAHEFLAENVFYHNIPMEPIIGRDKARAFCDSFGLGVSMFADWRIVNIAEQGDMVLTERIDSFTLADGRRISVPLMGSFKIKDGQITEWRDYFDLATFQRQLAEPPTTHAPRPS